IRGDDYMKVVENKIEVRYQETDQMGVVYHGNYLVWFEIGRTKFVNELGLKYTELESLGYYSPVIDINIHFKKALTYGQVATVKTKLIVIMALERFMNMKSLMREVIWQ